MKNKLLLVTVILFCAGCKSGFQSSENPQQVAGNNLEVEPAALPPLELESSSTSGTVVTSTYIFSRPAGVPLHIIVSRDSSLTGALPAILHIHGGAFLAGTPDPDKTITWARAGYVAASLEYRLSPGATGESAALGGFPFPAAVHDCKTAIRFLRAYASQLGLDPSKIGTTGESAGGYFSLMMAASFGNSYLEGDGDYQGYSTEVQAAVSMYGSSSFPDMNLEYDHTPNPEELNMMNHGTPDAPDTYFLGVQAAVDPSLANLASPAANIIAGGKYPPILMIHGLSDTRVIAHQSYLMYAKLKSVGASAELIYLRNLGHGFERVEPGSPVADYTFYTWSVIPNLESFVKLLQPFSRAKDFFNGLLK